MPFRRVTALGALAATMGLGLATAGGGAAQQPSKTALFAHLRGANEVDARGRRGAGDGDGRGAFAAVVKNGRHFCFSLTVTAIGTPVGAHIHRGRAGRNGPIVVAFTHPTAGDPGISGGCGDIDPAVLRAIRRRPGNYYVNVHTRGRPGGSIRGQLFKATSRQDR
jgi:hypothetical protein